MTFLNISYEKLLQIYLFQETGNSVIITCKRLKVKPSIYIYILFFNLLSNYFNVSGLRHAEDDTARSCFSDVSE